MIHYKILILVSILLLKTTIASAQTPTNEHVDNVFGMNKSENALFCDRIFDESEYDVDELQSYKMLVPGKDDWIFRTNSDFKTYFQLTDGTLLLLERLNKQLEKAGIKLIMLYVPTRGMMHYSQIRESDKQDYDFTNLPNAWRSYRRAAREISDTGIDVVTIPQPENEIDFFYKRDHHWNQKGAEYSAQVLAEYITNLDIYDDIPTKEYVTRSGSEFLFEGVSKKVFKMLCNTEQKPELITIKQTEPVKTASSADALFGNVEHAQIALVGTSNSTQIPSYANFHGYLMQHLNADVLNMSVSGGGLDEAMLDYLKSDFFENNPAKILVWEVPSYYNLNNHKKFLRQAIASTYRNCGEEIVANADGINLDKNYQLLMNNLEEKNISGSEHYVYIEFENDVIEPFKIDLRYKGNRDRYYFKISDRESRKGPYVMTLNDEKPEKLDKLVIINPAENFGNKLSVKICRTK
jgi:alginate biosynthesis protein AlgX